MKEISTVTYREAGRTGTTDFAIQNVQPNPEGGVDLFLYFEDAETNQQVRVTLNKEAVAEVVAAAKRAGECGPILLPVTR